MFEKIKLWLKNQKNKNEVVDPIDWLSEQEDFETRRFSVILTGYDISGTRFYHLDQAILFAKACARFPMHWEARIIDRQTNKTLYVVRSRFLTLAYKNEFEEVYEEVIYITMGYHKI